MVYVAQLLRSEFAALASLSADLLIHLRLLPDDRFEVEQVLVDADFQHAADAVAGLAGVVAVGGAEAVLAEAHVARRLGDDLVRQHLAVAADEVLVPLVGRAGEATLHQPGVLAAAPRAAPLAGRDRGLFIYHACVLCPVTSPALCVSVMVRSS